MFKLRSKETNAISSAQTIPIWTWIYRDTSVAIAFEDLELTYQNMQMACLVLQA